MQKKVISGKVTSCWGTKGYIKAGYFTVVDQEITGRPVR